MDIVVLGPGAIGTLLGGLLRLGGHDVTLVGRRRAEKPGQPIRIIHPAEWLIVDGLRYRPFGALAERGAAEATLVTLGRHHLRAIRRPEFAGLVADGGPVFFFNGDPTEPQRLAVAPERSRLGLTLTAAVKLQDGDVELAESKSVIVVEKHPENQRLFGPLARYGFEILEVDDARPFMNSFFLSQLLSLPVALCNLTLTAFLSSPEGRELARNILLEGFHTLEKTGEPLAPLPVMDPRDLLARLEKKPLSFQGHRDEPDRAYNTVLQAYLRGRQTESLLVNRRLVEIASSVGLHLVWNWRVAQKAGRVGSTGFYRDPDELLRSLE